MIRSAKLALICLAPALAAPADAGWSRRCRPAHAPLSTCGGARVDNPRGYPPRCGPPGPALASRALPAPQSAYASPQGAYVAPRGGPQAHQEFLGWLNATRAASGLGPVGWDPALAADAAANSSYGFNHNVMGRARRQNVGVGDLGSVSAAWLASGRHASALLDPQITRAGLANVGGVWTFSAD